MEAADYSVPIYLNQSIVFDLLAIMEDGLAQVSTIRTSETTKGGSEAGIGASNVFALLGITLKAARDSQSGTETTHERVHTPSSLFAKVRNRLRTDKLVRDLTKGDTALDDVRAGQFVEIELTLRRNPLAEALQAMVETAGGIRLLQAFNKEQGKSAMEKQQEATLQKVTEQAKRLVTALTSGGAIDLIGPLIPGPGIALLAAEKRYFADHSSNEIADGRFRAFGKVVRNTTGSDEAISLLRNTQFAHMPQVMEPLVEGIKTVKQSGLTIPDAITVVPPPALQILPIAIFL